MEQVFVATDIILDLLSERHPFYNASANLFSAADLRKISICVSSLTFSNLSYILSKQFSTARTRNILLKFRTLVTVLPVTDRTVDLALSSDFKDFEDALQYFTAIEHDIKMLLTRNFKHYKTADIPVMSADEYLKDTSSI